MLDIVLDTLVTWLPNHIKHDDAQYAAFLAEAQQVAEGWMAQSVFLQWLAYNLER